MPHYLITGGAGFIGSHIVEYLATQTNHKITVIDNLLTGSMKNIETFQKRIRFLKYDITDTSRLEEIFNDVDYVIHQAALPSVPRSIEDPIKSNWNNINGTLNLLVAAKNAGITRFVAASSSSVYGSEPTLPKIETLPTIPKSPYALTKLATEHYCRLFHSIYGLETVSLRYFNVFGPRQNPKSQYSAVIPLFISKLLNAEPVIIHGDGEQTRDFTYVENVVQANLLACTAPDAAGKAYNIGCQHRTSINQLFDHISKLVGKTAKPMFTEARTGDVKHSLADISAAKSTLNYHPRISVEDGLTKTVAYYTSIQA
ncbi:SDR family oxidoreductase [bacterium]|nr:SDR family oxidoreductase [bacterium]